MGFNILKYLPFVKLKGKLSGLSYTLKFFSDSVTWEILALKRTINNLNISLYRRNNFTYCFLKFYFLSYFRSTGEKNKSEVQADTILMLRMLTVKYVSPRELFSSALMQSL